MITRNEVVKILALAAAYDHRAVGEADVDAWLIIATESAWTYPLARRCVIEYNKHDGDRPRIRPAHINDSITATRDTIRRQAFRTDLVPPRELADDPAAEIAWRRQTTEHFIDRALAAWADEQPLPELDPAVQSTERATDTRRAES